MRRALKSASSLFACSLGLQLLSWPWIDDVRAFSIFPFNHQEVTLQALGACCFEYTLPNGAKVSFNTDAANAIMAGNVNMDILSLHDEQLAEDFHFDDERFDFGQFVLLYTRDLLVVQLQDEAFAHSDPQNLLRRQMLTRTSREMLGNALHTLQDYYAHTNWVERGLQNGNLAINPVLGAKGKSLHGPSEQTCDENAPGSSQLTSGYYLASGVFDCSNICSAPANECAHGNINCPGLSCGINKDVSPRNHFAEAFDLATEHTALFVRQIFGEALDASPEVRSRASVAICQFMGVPDPANTCLTHFTINVEKLNQATGQATLEGRVVSESTVPAIDCGPQCQATASAGSSVQLTASDGGDWVFQRWAQGGACGGSSSRSCTLSMDSNQTARAVFAEIEPTPMERQSYQYSCILEIYAQQKSCNHTPDAGSGSAMLHEELGADYGGTPESGGGFAYIEVDGQIDAQAGQSSIEATVDASAVGQWFSRGSQSITAEYSNSVWVTSSTLPMGTAVLVRATFQINLQYARSVTLSEPPTVQWGAAWPTLSATVEGGGSSQVIVLENPNDASQAINKTRTESIDVVFASNVGAVVPITVTLGVNSNSIQAARAHVTAELGARVNGPYLAEANGLNVQFSTN